MFQHFCQSLAEFKIKTINSGAQKLTQLKYYNKIPVIQAVIKQAIEPAIKALMPNLAKSD